VSRNPVPHHDVVRKLIGVTVPYDMATLWKNLLARYGRSVKALRIIMQEDSVLCSMIIDD
jgi:hypothetical protein